jgi:hypothetical protein
MSDEAEEKRSHMWKPGQSGNPLGRPVGSRNRINEKFLTKLERICDEHGDAMMEKAALAEPMQFIKMWAGLQPTKVEAKMTSVSIFAHYDLTDPQEYLAAWKHAEAVLGITAPIEVGYADEVIEEDEELDD